MDSVLVMIDHPDRPRQDPAEALRPEDAADPQVLVNDLGITRGDGIFEVAGSVDGRVHALQAHLDRFARSARLMDLPAPDQPVYRAAVHTALGRLAARLPGRELSCKFIMTRGLEYPPGAHGPTGWAVAMIAPDYRPQRRAGIVVVTLDRGVRRDVMQTSPWLLAGAKSLSYAVNRSVVREAVRRGADDTLLVSSDGYVLEGPSASFLALIDGEVVTPPASDGVLPGTTQADAFAWFAQQGIPTRVRSIDCEELAGVRSAWLTSSTRLAAPIRELDGRPLDFDPDLTARLNEHLLGRDG
ncbi:4-amino-4-deoxychorismate lyase [Raineyella antarctica]|uniref:4-amino-4-deoxychorismate lyase n=1 Tax=Raineyella antarctica TaxID=1577474 RepID=A0A1G6HBV0_9ACTN|nr:aminotransferase class IV [Raineyella antarctica]SDB91633.1 4-amino-4-deoxychorismate lyase [Raineyella antarctica]